ncbi:hypothetical protein SEPCBS119000_002030 [Sporothrix epigloea]|uniref:YAG7-like dimerisation domain-containing protein n=1 Tax=Sporothrix epigloea TaxID=1892477 RepID=A0ABP0DH31_9PEZI
MAASAIQNSVASVDTKVDRKKKVKARRTESPAPTAPSERALSVAPADANGDDSSEPVYLRELSRNIRNANKRLTNITKTDGLVAEHKDKSLDELVTLKIINTDQKAQILKKPAIQFQLAQYEEQYSQFKKLDTEFRERLASEKAEITKTMTDKFEQEKADAVREATEAATAASEKTLHDSLLTLSQFLRLAAARRADDQNQQLDENLALEGVLLQIYSGDENGVATMLKLVQGAEETTEGVSNEPLQTTFAQVKAAAAASVVPVAQAEADEVLPDSHVQVDSDPTLVHASLTEIDAGIDTPFTENAALTNGHIVEDELLEPAASNLANADVGDEAANAAGEAQWDTANGSKDLSTSQEWVQVPRDPTETENGLNATTSTLGNTQSWADEQAEQPDVALPTAISTVGATATNAVATEHNDGFHQVQRHNRGRSERDVFRGRGGGYRGRGRGGGGENRGRGGRGGRGRGGSSSENSGNGNNGGFHRGPRRNADS